MRDWMNEPEEPDDDRETVAVCEHCGGDIKGETARWYGDDYYNFGELGCVHSDCLLEWVKQFKR